MDCPFGDIRPEKLPNGIAIRGTLDLLPPVIVAA
jgi:hypothetical protein